MELIHESLSCVSEDEIRNVMSKLSALIPYQAAASFITKISGNGAMEAMRVVNVDYPAEYLVELGKRGLVAKDPIVIENFKSFKLQYWADTMKRLPSLTADNYEVLSLAEDFGFHKVRAGCGYGHGVSNLKRTEGSFFCYQGMERSDRTEEILELVIPHFHGRFAASAASQKTVYRSPQKKPRYSSGSNRAKPPGTYRPSWGSANERSNFMSPIFCRNWMPPHALTRLQ